MKYVGFSSPSEPIVESNCKLEVVPEKIQAVWHQIALSEGTTTHEKEQVAKPVMAVAGGGGGSIAVLHAPQAVQNPPLQSCLLCVLKLCWGVTRPDLAKGGFLNKFCFSPCFQLHTVSGSGQWGCLTLCVVVTNLSWEVLPEGTLFY